MNAQLAVLSLLAASGCLWGQGLFQWENTSVANWVTNGSDPSLHSSSGGAWIFAPAVSGANSNDYEVNSPLAIHSGGGTYVHFLRAGTGVTPGTGSYISVEFAVPNTWQNGGSVPITVNQCVGGTVTQLAATSVVLHDGDTVRSIVWGTTLWVLVNNFQYGIFTIPSSTGQPGFGGYSIPTGSGIDYTTVRVGHHDTTGPSTVSRPSVATSLLPDSVSMKWQGVADDTYGIGVFRYLISRGGSSIATVVRPEYTDATASASTTYTYSIQAQDFHGNLGSATSITVTTPPATAVDPRRIGVVSGGAYWGGGGEQIDMLSGNLNFAMTLGAVQGRNGWKVPVNLVYNSQNWRRDGSANWQLGGDVGFGFGWKYQIGSLTPYYTQFGNGVNHYVFADGTGAEYRLDVNSSGVWTSTQAIYVWFDSNTNILHFKDGMFWVMGCISGGIEPDAGTMYPTIIEDVSGNQVVATYDTAFGLALGPYQYNGSPLYQWNLNTSARLLQVQGVDQTITFHYNYSNWSGAPYRYLTEIGLPNETLTPTYSSASIQPPFGSDSTFTGSVNRIASVAVASVAGASYTFTYDGGASSGGQELTQVAFPWGGHLRWDYATDGYSGSRSMRAVTTRYLAADSSGATEWTYPITRDTATSAILHATATLADASGNGVKTWFFFTPATTGDAWKMGLAYEFVQKASTSGATYTDDTYTWSQDAGNHPYISQKDSVMDPAGANVSARTKQTLDQYGNVTESAIYPYNNTTTAFKTFDSTYLTNSGYIANYLRNRVLLTTLTTGGTMKTLAENYYDGKLLDYQTTYPTGGCYWGSSWNPWTNNTVTTLRDTSTALAWRSQGLMSVSVSPATTTCLWYHNYGAMGRAAGSDGSVVQTSADSATNYAAPQTVSTQSYSESIAYNSWLGITSTTGLNGEQLLTSYDSYGRPSTSTSPYGATTTYGYSALSLPMQQTKTGPDGYTRTTLDGLGRVVKVERGPNSSTIQSVVDTVYAPCACSPLGKLWKTSQPYAPGGTPVWSVYSYDGIGRTLSVVQPDGASTTSYSYLGNQTTVTDPAGKWKKFTTDVEGNLTTVTEPDPANPTTATFTTTYTYDWMKHLSGVSMTRGSTQTRSFVYDDSGHLTSATNPESGTVSYYYNSDNTLWYKHDAKGQDTVYAYDSTKRVTSIKRYPTGKNNSEDTCQRVTYSYDTNSLDSTFSQHAQGRLTTVQYNACVNSTAIPVTEMYSYHAAGAVTNKWFEVYRCDPIYSDCSYHHGGSLEVAYTYDSAGRINNYGVSSPSTDPSSFTTTSYTYGFDSMGRPVSLTDGTTYYAQNGAYDPAGRMTGLQTLFSTAGGNKYEAETRTYNVNGQLSSQGWTCTGCSGAVTGSITYTYSPTQNNGQITGITDQVSGETLVYLYDSMKRMYSAASTPISGTTPTAYTQTFQYDGFGNLTAKALNGTTTTIAVTAATNQLSSASYDSNGNMTSGAGVTLGYDEANRVKSAAPTSGGTEYYGYAPDNKRIVRQKSNGTQEWTFYGAKSEKLGVYSLGGPWDLYNGQGTVIGDTYWWTLLRESVWFAGKLVREGGSPVVQDRLGTNRMGGARFYPFGEEIGTASANDRTKFATYNRDGFTGLDYADQRYFASSYGRFNSPDPLSSSASPTAPDSWNRYSYVSGDPVNRSDPSGTFACTYDPSYDDCDPYGNPIGVGGLSFSTAPPVNCDFPASVFGEQGCECAANLGRGLSTVGCGSIIRAIDVLNYGGQAGSDSGNLGFGFADKADKIEGLYDQIQKHLDRITQNPNSRDVPHWQKEINTWVRDIVDTVEKITQKRREGAADKLLKRIIGVTIEELENLVTQPIIIVNPCAIGPQRLPCPRRGGDGPDEQQ